MPGTTGDDVAVALLGVPSYVALRSLSVRVAVALTIASENTPDVTER